MTATWIAFPLHLETAVDFEPTIPLLSPLLSPSTIVN